MAAQQSTFPKSLADGKSPLRARGHVTRSRIVEVAAELFYRNGVARTGMAEIANASRTGKGQLYHYFTSKSEIVSAAIEAQTEKIVGAQKDLLEAMSTPQDLRDWASAAAAAHAGTRPARCPLGALTVGIADVDPGLRHDLDDGFRRWRTILAGALGRLQDAGHVRVDRPAEDWAEILLCAYEGGLVLAEARGDLRPLRNALETAVELMLTRGTPER